MESLAEVMEMRPTISKSLKSLHSDQDPVGSRANWASTYIVKLDEICFGDVPQVHSVPVLETLEQDAGEPEQANLAGALVELDQTPACDWEQWIALPRPAGTCLSNMVSSDCTIFRPPRGGGEGDGDPLGEGATYNHPTRADG